MLNTDSAVKSAITITLDNLSDLIATITERTTLKPSHSVTNLRYRVHDTFKEIRDNLEEDLGETVDIDNLHNVLQFAEEGIADLMENYRKEEK